MIVTSGLIMFDEFSVSQQLVPFCHKRPRIVVLYCYQDMHHWHHRLQPSHSGRASVYLTQHKECRWSFELHWEINDMTPELYAIFYLLNPLPTHLFTCLGVSRPKFEHRHWGCTGVEKDAETNRWFDTETFKVHKTNPLSRSNFLCEGVSF